VRRGQSLLVDAFCGSGLFAKHLAPLFEKVVGIEENSHAIESARRNAQANEHYICGDVAAHLSEVLGAHDSALTTVVLDPPAAGLSGLMSEHLCAHRPAEVIYVSCDPATMARDLGRICAPNGPYRLESVTPLDMFPQTAEIAHLVLAS
jgi:23S rRNA (uracil1939-C5)-methyltransferase